MLMALAGALALAAGDAQTSAALPSGLYRYTMFEDGKAVALSVISVTRTETAVQIMESTTLSGDAVTTIRTFDPATFTTLRYETVALNAKSVVQVTPANATLTNAAKATTTVVAKTAGPAMVFDYSAGPYIAMPAMLNATKASAMNIYCECFEGFDVKVATVVPVTMTRPSKVPARDQAAAFSLDDGIATLWYDPGTFILHQMDVPKVKISIVLQEGT